MNLTEFETMLKKCYAYTNKPLASFPDDYRVNYEKVALAIEKMDCAENVRAVLRERYRYGNRFTTISRTLGITYQWVYELHKSGVSLLYKHMSV